MDQLMQANLQIIELLGAVFEEVRRQGDSTDPRRPERPAGLRTWVGRPVREHGVTTSCAPACN